MKKTNKIIIAVVAVVVVIALVMIILASTGVFSPKDPIAQSQTTTDPATDTGKTDEPTYSLPNFPEVKYNEDGEIDTVSYMERSEAIYDYVLGDFAEAYAKAFEAATLSERYALMAIAEAKLLETGVMLPTTTKGGNYAITRVAPKTISSVMWGNDNTRYHQAIVATELITAADRAALKGLYADAETSADYEEAAKKYLTDHGYELQDSYSLAYSSDPQTWDVLATSKAADSEAIVNTYDGLVEYDSKNQLQPALATEWTKSADGKTYTFTIRSNQVWVDKDGTKVADVTADDFVAGFQHMLDAKGGLQSLVSGIVVGVKEYLAGEAEFNEVGVKAEGNKVVYTLTDDCSYFMSMLTYGLFAPMSRSYYQSQGGKFGSEYNATAEDYNYGRDSEHIAYCGPYTVTNNTAKNTIEFTANEKYWNAAKVNAKKIIWKYNDGIVTTKAYEDAKAGTTDGSGLNSDALALAKTEDYNSKNIFDTYVYVTDTDSTSYMNWVNINRISFANTQDGALPSPKTEEQKKRAQTALLNQHFRLALDMAIDRISYNGASVGADLAATSLRNSYTPGVFVVLSEDTTVSINGKATTFKTGTYYGKIMQAQIDADGYAMKVWNDEADGGIGSSDGYDGWYNPTAAKAELDKAIAELAQIGVAISEENPIYVDFYYYGSAVGKARANVYQQSIKSALGSKVVVNLVEATTADDYYNFGYNNDEGWRMNYDLSNYSGWGPDYGDPQTYLDTFLGDGDGYMTISLSLF
ncbi:MAG: peptide ABC transporter substrate-binding protein [Clostridia bacterium]|nr:peptide ABC transporter substrate-binding protein [Clostridia bacterium]